MRTRRTLPIGARQETESQLSVPHLDPYAKPETKNTLGQKVNFPSPNFEPSGEESAAEGLPEGVKIRWFRNLGARPMIVAPSAAMPKPLTGAIVWTDEGIGVDLTAIGAAAVVIIPRIEEGVRTLTEPSTDTCAPTLREAVDGALEAVPTDVREGARGEVEWAFGQVGL